MTTSLSNITVKDGQNTLVVKANDITINGSSILATNNFVTLDTNQTITGQKTFTAYPLITYAGSPLVITKSTNADSIASTDVNLGIGSFQIKDKNNLITGYLYSQKQSNNNMRFVLETRYYSDTSTYKHGSLQIIVDKDYNYYSIINGSGTSNLSLSRVTNSTTDITIPTMGWVNNPATSINVVHRSGDETITDNKTLTGETSLQGTSADITDTTNTYNFGVTHYRDKNGNGYFYTKAYQDSSRYMFELAGNFGTNSWKNGIQIGYDRSNEKMFARISTPATSDNSTQIATTAFVKAQGYLTSHQSLSNYVTLNSDQTISGTKTIQNKSLVVKNTVADDEASSISGTVEYGMVINDKNGSRIGNFYGGQRSNGQIRTYMCACRPVNGSTVYKYVEISQNVDGTGNFNISCNTAIAPTPAVSDNSTKIATTAYCNNKHQVVSALPASPDANVFYYIPA